MIADYFNNFDLGALVSGGNSGNVCNITSEAAKNGPLPVTILDKTVKLETVTAGNSKRSVTDVTSTAVAAVTALQPATPRIDTASAAMLPPLPLLPHQRPCYCCKGIDYWLAGTEKSGLIASVARSAPSVGSSSVLVGSWGLRSK